QRAEADGGHGHNSQRPQSDTGGKLHNGFLLFVDWWILLNLVEHVGATIGRPWAFALCQSWRASNARPYIVLSYMQSVS
ncbi:hypothetical protein, partial [uncultured Gemmiger sp.]|uniref:hypothetical protein n=1 Tax=uncultured Gemmiger sp. TaxID=1623490 RepID=UPI0025FFEF2F